MLTAIAGLGFFACTEDTGPGGAGPSGVTVTTTSATTAGADGGAGGAGVGGSGAGADATGGATSAGGAGGGATGPEDCYNGLDDDGDTATDCDDSDCEVACKDPCASPNVIADPTEFLEFDNTGHVPMAQGASCGSKNGPAAVYKITTVKNGMLDVQLSADEVDVTLSIRQKCSDATTQFGCSEQAIDSLGTPAFEFVSVAIPDKTDVYIVVEGYGAMMSGKYYLYAKSREIDCGDGLLDPVEECEDGNPDKGDGCSDLCKLESSEDADNGSFAKADLMLGSSFHGEIDPTNDVDYLAFNVPGPNYSAVVQVKDHGNGACGMGTMDPVATIYGPSQALLAMNDDYDGRCPRVEVTGLAAGVHFLKIARSTFGKPTFAYRADLELDQCGNNMVLAAETCDDGNTVGGDGCSALCLNE